MSHPAHYNHEWPPNAKSCGKCGGHQITPEDVCDVFVLECLEEGCGHVSRVSNDGIATVCKECGSENTRLGACGGQMVAIEPYPVVQS